jgi:uncharacterized membrane-anchored protein
MPESARWLLTQGRVKEAQKEVLRAARVNGRTISEAMLSQVSDLCPTFTSFNGNHIQIKRVFLADTKRQP